MVLYEKTVLRASGVAQSLTGMEKIVGSFSANGYLFYEREGTDSSLLCRKPFATGIAAIQYRKRRLN
jgi:hypothetical protein